MGLNNYKKYILITLLFGLFIFSLVSAQNFIGPSCTAGQCQGKISVDLNGNISIGTSTPQSDTRTYIVASTSDSSAYGLRILSSNSSPILWVRNDGKVSIATTSFTYALNVAGDIYASGNLLTGGSFSAALSAGNVTPGVFNSLQGGGTGAYAFLGSLGIATTSQVGLPQALSVYGGGYFSGNVGIGTTTPGYKLHISNGDMYIDGSNYGYDNLIITRTAGAVGPGITLMDKFGDGTLDSGIVFKDGTSVLYSIKVDPAQNNTNLFQIGNSTGGVINLNQSGNVGIGTSTPAYKLDVQGGQINASGGLCIAGDCKTAWSQVGGSSSQWTTTSTGIYYSGGNVGIGNVPSASLPLNIETSSTAYTGIGLVNTDVSSRTWSIFANSNSTTFGPSKGFGIRDVTAGATRLVIDTNGNVGIGTVDPTYPLHVESTGGAGANPAFYFRSTANRPVLYVVNADAAASTYVLFYLAGDNVNDSAFGTGLTGETYSRFNFTVNGDMRWGPPTSGKDVRIYRSTTSVLTIDNSTGGAASLNVLGALGVGTTAPGYKLDVADRMRVRQGPSGSAGIWFYQTTPGVGDMGFIGAVDDNYIGIWGSGAGFGFAMNRTNGYVGIGTTTPGYKLDVASAGSVTARFGTASTDQVTIGNGAGKLNVGTVDPPYTINGKKYATYVSAMTGQKEETTGIIKVKNSECQIKNNSKICESKINFNLEPEGSDLWLFSKVTNLKNNFNKMAVILSPDSKGKSWYSKNNNLVLSIYFEPEEEKENYEISYRLTAPRFDADKFLNERNNSDPNEPEGLIINE